MSNRASDPRPDEETRRQQVDAVRRWGPTLARAIIVLVVVFGIVSTKLWLNQQRTIDQLQSRQVLGCHRTNIERASQNKQNYADYSLFSLILRISAKQKQPVPKTAAERKGQKQALASFEADIAAKAYTPLTYCYPPRSTNIRRLYTPPTPVSFISIKKNGKPAPPPRSAFVLQPGQ